MNKKTIIISVSIIVIALAGLIIFRMMNNSNTTFYSDEHIKGNTSCNLLNGGLFCEIDNTIYFSNPNAGGSLYSMNSELKRIKLVYPDNASFLNVAGKYIFYTKRNDKKPIDSDAIFSFNNTGLYRLVRNSRKVFMLSEHTTQTACLYGNHIYYQHFDENLGFLLYSAKIDASEDKRLLEDSCTPTAVDNDTIYYTGIKHDHNIHTMNISGSGDSVLYEGNCTGLAKQGNYLYFLDMDHNYQLKRISIDGGMVETLVKDRVLTYNVSPNEDVLYCQIDHGKKENGLYELNLGTLSLTPIATGDFNYLHLTKNYLFYEEYDQSKVYFMNLATRSTNELVLPNGTK